MIWHYTIGTTRPLILESGVIRCVTAAVPKNERPIVWFSTNQHWEQTACRGLVGIDGTYEPLDADQTAGRFGGLVGIGVASEIAPYDWCALRRLADIKSKIARDMEESAIRCGASWREWRGTFDPVPSKKWAAIERLHEDAWVSMKKGLNENEFFGQPLGEVIVT